MHPMHVDLRRLHRLDHHFDLHRRVRRNFRIVAQRHRVDQQLVTLANMQRKTLVLHFEHLRELVLDPRDVEAHAQVQVLNLSVEIVSGFRCAAVLSTCAVVTRRRCRSTRGAGTLVADRELNRDFLTEHAFVFGVHFRCRACGESPIAGWERGHLIVSLLYSIF